MQLRGYQNEFLKAVKDNLEKGVQRQLGVMSTGSGKTQVAASLPSYLNMPSVLFLAHREELINQAAHRFKELNPSYNIGIEKADMSAVETDNVVIASIPTLGRASSLKRLQRFDPHRFDIVICDEAHHSTSKSYLQVFRHFQPKLLLGITATPMRGDGTPLANVYDKISFIRTIPQLITEGEADATLGPYLSRVRGIRVKSSTDLRNIHIRAGDFAEGELAAAVNVDARNSMIISAIEQHLEDRSSILLFAVDKAHVEILCQQLKDRGHLAEFVVDHTKSTDRAERIRAFKGGHVRIMVNCGIFTEGTDIPNIDAVVMARPVLSPVLYMQMIGRGMRVSPGKDHCVVMDVVDTVGKLNVQTIGDAFGVRGCDFLGEDVYEKAQVVRRAQELGVDVAIDDTIEIVERKADTIEKVVKGTIVIDTKAQLIDVLSISNLADEVQNDSSFPWVKINHSTYVLPMPNNQVSELTCDALGVWQYKKGDISVELDTPRTAAPFKWADKQVKKLHTIQEWKMKRVEAKWRQQPATPKQIGALRNKFRVQIIPQNFTKGSASDLFDFFAMTKQKLQRLANA